MRSSLKGPPCELLLENYVGHLRELAHQKGLRLSIEAYDGPCDDLRYAGRVKRDPSKSLVGFGDPDDAEASATDHMAEDLEHDPDIADMKRKPKRGRSFRPREEQRRCLEMLVPFRPGPDCRERHHVRQVER